MKNIILIVLLGLSIFSMESCRRETPVISDELVYFSEDTLHFDTTFTSTTTATQRVLIYNRSSSAVKVNRIYIEGGASSYFHFGIDGQTGQEARDIVILPNDSSYLFVSVTVDPNSDSVPFLVTDRIIAETGKGSTSLALDAYGQNAIFYRDTTLQSMNWTPDLPIVLLGNVEVAEGATLTIEPGTRVYTQSKKYLVVSGTLNAIGTKTDSIIFQGNRLDRDYWLNEDHPGEWGGIILAGPSSDNRLEHVIIKNATYGIFVDSLSNNSNYKLDLNKCTIYNCLNYGIYSRNGSVSMVNSRLISSNVNLAFIEGGSLYMNHCTLGGYSIRTNQHSTAYRSLCMAVLNYRISQNILYQADLDAKIYNSIIAGSLSQEAAFDSVETAGYYLELRNNLLKTTSSEAALSSLAAVYEYNILNEEPEFEDTYKADYSFGPSSPCYRATSIFPLSDDINDKLRSSPTDIGCEEMD